MMRRLCIALIFSAAAFPALASEIGRVKRTAGEAAIARAGETLPAAPGMVLQEQDALVTGADGSLAVTFIDNSRFAAGPNSRVELSTFRFNATTHDGEFDTRLQRGTLAIISGQIAKRKPDAMKIRTPSSILGVRGTEFIVEAAE